MEIEPGVDMSEGVPGEVSGDACQHGEDDEEDAASKAEGLKGAAEATFDADGQERDDRRPGKAIEEPEDGQAKGQAEGECAHEGVAPSAAGREAEEVFKIGCERADDDSGEDQPGAAQGQGRGGVRCGEGHEFIMAAGRGETRSGSGISEAAGLHL